MARRRPIFWGYPGLNMFRWIKRKHVIVPTSEQIKSFARPVYLKQSQRYPFSSKLDYFKIFRAYRLAEQHLLNHRLTWNLATQGFLFATYGLCLQKIAEIEAGENGAKICEAQHTVQQMRDLMWITPRLGLFLSACICAGVLGSLFALLKLRGEWTTEIEQRDLLPYTPDPSGGGSKQAFWLGLVPPVCIPLVFALAWIVLMIRGTD